MSRPAKPGMPEGSQPAASGRGRTSSTEPAYTDDPAPAPRLEVTVEIEASKPSLRQMILDGDIFRVGSHASNECVLADPLVSRLHFQLRNTPSGWRIVDTGSLNGTRVNGVSVRDADVTLPECRIHVGQSVVRVQALPTPGQTGPAIRPLNFGGLYGGSAVMARLFGRIAKVSAAGSDVLIEGESGTGKELIAAEIVQRSNRAQKPFVIVDCGAISRSLIESELFGHAKGAFTGAERARAGAFEAADGGTVFLDEIGELPIEMQPKLLRALAAREVRRVGENETRKVDVRVIAATNRRLEGEVNQGRFREDLYFRLSVLRIDVPPLRDHLDDLPILIGHFMDALGVAEKMFLFNSDVLAEMRQHSWPGNVRELRNYVQRFAVFDDRSLYHDARLTPSSSSSPPATGSESQLLPVSVEHSFREGKDRLVKDFEHRYLTELLAWADGNVSRAARKAGLDRMYLHRLLQRHGLRRGEPFTD